MFSRRSFLGMFSSLITLPIASRMLPAERLKATVTSQHLVLNGDIVQGYHYPRPQFHIIVGNHEWGSPNRQLYKSGSPLNFLKHQELVKIKESVDRTFNKAQSRRG